MQEISSYSLDECTIGTGSNVESCYNATCSWYHSTDTNKGEGKCENTDSHISPALDLVTEIRMFEKYKKQEDEETTPIRGIFKHDSSMKFWCELNNCNNQKVAELIKEAVNEQNDLWSINKIHETDRKQIIK
jgi:hypothetical protein